MSQEQRARPSSVTKARTVEREEDVVLPSDECFRPPEGTCTPRPTEFHASPSSHRGGQGALHTPHTQVTACFGAEACQETLRGSKCMCHQTNGSQPSSQGARSPQVSVSARSHTRIQSVNPRSSEPAGLCLCSQPYSHPKYQSKELGARRPLSLLPPKRSHDTMKACNQCNQQVSMQRHQPLAAAGHTSSKELGA